ncbi:putative ABC transporter permease [Clostridium sp. WILCCON 0269]|uniref:ABC transporter permease n=1 Tax=Candidatus Clostridium eludens TaxID=3381663 RepID=A0ABW8SQM1_9CLOT
MKNKVYKDIILIFIMGALYMVLEGMWRGWTHISMLVVGGISAFLIGRLNEHPAFYDRKMWQECIIGTAIILILEFTSGMVLNVWLKLNIWDYSDTWGNLYGQICIPYAILWFILVPFCVFVDDYLRYKLFGEKKPLELLQNYEDLFTGN